MRQGCRRCSPVADRGVGNMGDGFHQQGRVGGDISRSLEIDMTRQRTDAENIALTAMLAPAR